MPTFALVPVAALLFWFASTAAAGPFTVSAYEVELCIDRGAHRVAGHERVHVRSHAEGLARISFPRNDLSVANVRDAHGRPLAFTASGEQVEITLEPPLGRGATTTIELDYEASSPLGVHFDAEAVYTTFHTCHWMVCREEPGARARLTLALLAPQGLSVVASGEPVARAAAPDGLARHVWKQTAPYPAYLFGFALGSFQKRSERHGGVTLEYYAVPSVPAAALSALSAPTQAALDFFGKCAGRRFPTRRIGR